MAERSLFWTTNNTGHGPSSGYASDRWQAFLRKAFLSNIASSGGVAFGVDNQLAVSGTASPVTVATGAAFVYGFFYENDAPINLAISTPVVGTTGGHIILRANFAAQTVTAIAVRNTDGTNTTPALTQTPGTTYEIRLASFTITTGGVVALTDTRVFAKFAGKIASDQLTAAVLTGALGYTPANRAGDTISGGFVYNLQTLLTNTLYDDAAIELRTDAAIDPTAVPAIGFHRVAEVGAAIYLASGGDYASFRVRGNGGQDVPLWNGGNDGNGSGLDADLVAGVDIAPIRRQGGSAANWSTAGTSNYTPANYIEQLGVFGVTITAGNPSFTFTVTFPTAFAQPPHIQLTVDEGIGAVAGFAIARTADVTATNFKIVVRRENNVNFTSSGTAPVYWRAIGPTS